MTRCYATIILLALTLSLMGLGALVAGILGNVWFITSDGKQFFGLLEDCPYRLVGKDCVKRDLFQFKASFTEDLILVGLIVSSVFAFVSSVLVVVLYYCERGTSPWRCCLYVTYLTTMITAAVSLATVSYNEYVGRKLYDYEYKHGWSVLLVWVGAGELLLACVFVFVLRCVVRARTEVDRENNFIAQNLGYEMR